MARLAFFAIFLAVALLTPEAHASGYYGYYPRPAGYKATRFIKRYLDALGTCRIPYIRTFYTKDFVTFRAIGLAGNKAGQLDGVRGFCRSFKDVKFTLLEAVQVADLVVFIRVRASSPNFNAPVDYSEAILLKRKCWKWGKCYYRLRRDVLTASFDSFNKAVQSKP